MVSGVIFYMNLVYLVFFFVFFFTPIEVQLLPPPHVLDSCIHINHLIN